MHDSFKSYVTELGPYFLGFFSDIHKWSVANFNSKLF